MPTDWRLRAIPTSGIADKKKTKVTKMTLKHLYLTISALSIAVFVGTLTLFDVADESGTPSLDQPSFETTGRTSHDVLSALAALGELDTVLSDATSRKAQHAIEQAERRHGLQADGAPDRALLDRLIVELDKHHTAVEPSGSVNLDDWSTIVQMASSLSGILFSFLGWRRKA